MADKKEKINAPQETKPEPPVQPPPFHSVELTIDGLDLTYQFKIWQTDNHPLNIIIKEDSAIINRLKTGNRFNSKYYSEDTPYPMAELNTRISHITKVEEGKFKGHYIVGLSVEKGPAEIIMH